MLFAEKIKRLREELQIPQRQLAMVLEINTPMYSKNVAKDLQNENKL